MTSLIFIVLALPCAIATEIIVSHLGRPDISMLYAFVVGFSFVIISIYNIGCKRFSKFLLLLSELLYSLSMIFFCELRKQEDIKNKKPDAKLLSKLNAKDFLDITDKYSDAVVLKKVIEDAVLSHNPEVILDFMISSNILIAKKMDFINNC